ncbi:3-isopropylmalate dehydratase small subunit [Marinobacter salinexigens]|uniref:3-isopropylmalate dehydratase n=1 Tax=Marinobacter salinexigens TaxID=2919747 RepID=A0A5B0VNB8_9GAMM|nr:3-isopropylmalate dehydratase small subunit [Marinobacter salinexigens]KAA1175854.1 3-isopropylmalate dehydratase small subunit [Marinobacter salinexigens]
MKPLNKLTSIACSLPLENIDTDQLIPARFMKESRDLGYGGFLLHDMRFTEEGAPTDVILNHPEAEGTQIMVANRNFGAGSSREAAVYAMVDYGFRCVVAPSFGDIFSSNAVNNGLLPAVVSVEDYERLSAYLAEKPEQIHLNLEEQVIGFGDSQIRFDINPTWKRKLLNGWDDIDLTLAESEKIEQFRNRYISQFSWLA